MLAKAEHLKARQLGTAQGATPSCAPSLSTLELRALGEGCDLDTEALAELASARDAVSLSAP